MEVWFLKDPKINFKHVNLEFSLDSEIYKYLRRHTKLIQVKFQTLVPYTFYNTPHGI